MSGLVRGSPFTLDCADTSEINVYFQVNKPQYKTCFIFLATDAEKLASATNLLIVRCSERVYAILILMLRYGFIGGALGACLRFIIVPSYGFGKESDFQVIWLTMLVNVIAGLLAGAFISFNPEDKDNKLFVGGFLGGFSTVAAVSLHSSNFLEHPDILSRLGLAGIPISFLAVVVVAVLYITIINYFGCFLACKISYSLMTSARADVVHRGMSKLTQIPYIRQILGIVLFGAIILRTINYDELFPQLLVFSALLVLVFGGFGTILRLFLLERFDKNPTRTLLYINIVSSLLIVVVFLFNAKFGSENVYSYMICGALMTGFCGGFSSLSALAIDCTKNGHTLKKLTTTAVVCTLSSLMLFLLLYLIVM
ncbi:hypothetical protein FACS1894125_0820 [Actinomycetota bacterium]|nr:hypothetical protein FACS1894125_0820 [Actinomycetota bacterium]